MVEGTVEKDQLSSDVHGGEFLGTQLAKKKDVESTWAVCVDEGQPVSFLAGNVQSAVNQHVFEKHMEVGGSSDTLCVCVRTRGYYNANTTMLRVPPQHMVVIPYAVLHKVGGGTVKSVITVGAASQPFRDSMVQAGIGVMAQRPRRA